MPLITHALLYAGYALLALTTGLALAQVGGSTPGEATIGALALFCALAITHAGLSAAHAAGAVGRTEKKIKTDMDKLRAAHREVVAEMDAMGDRIDRIDNAVTEVAHRAVEPPREPEIKLIDRIVDKLGRQMDQRINEITRIAGPAPSRARGPIDMVREALDENRVELHLQPIVALPQRKSVFYEGFTRLKDENGRIMMPGDFMPAAEKAGLMPLIDNMLLFRCVQITKKLAQKDRRVAIFCNITPRALSDDAFFPQFLDFLREHRDMAGAVIFELPQDAFEARTSVEARAMAKLADLGYRFSIDKVTRLDIDIVDLERAGVRYFKVPGKLLIDGLIHEGVRPKSSITREIAANDVAAVFIRYGIDIIAERIEDEASVADILELEIPYAQGHLFGAPRAIKESLMEETAPPPGMFGRERGAA
ncbi:MAG: EAL domain-containing protein [Hyphomonadaceae bacterium]|nr:MAG: cyclic-di-GMP phosphodiesterase flagellum assembly factor TipF [Caulobacteraceae bacterium]MBT9446885.1 EAL domain-containing protein [Hyphomonadaceae bacterium]TPW05749.1 MAG: cyclic-di-GMP phosphodiesterase, flagellum assembly factor TipF [Alphaproteobacteria bacterium]